MHFDFVISKTNILIFSQMFGSFFPSGVKLVLGLTDKDIRRDTI